MTNSGQDKQQLERLNERVPVSPSGVMHAARSPVRATTLPHAAGLLFRA